MKQTIRLADLENMPIKAFLADSFTQVQIDAAREALVARDLRYNIKTGITRDNSGELARYCHKSDIPVYESMEQVLEWEFRCYVRNGASRLARGFEA